MAARSREEVYQRTQSRIDSLFDRISIRFQKTINDLRARPPRRGIEDEFEPGTEIEILIREHEDKSR